MANQSLFATLRGALIPKADTVNSHNAPAYALPPKQALAQYAATGCFTRTFYASAEEQLTQVLALCETLDPRFVARVAVYARKKAFLKDMPAFLCAWLSTRDARLHEAVFAKVIDNARMLRTYVQILRSGTVGRKSLGSAPKRLVRDWLASRDEESIFASSTGQKPSLEDVLRLVHPKPKTAQREAFYGYMLGRSHEANALPKLVLQYEQFKTGETLEVPDLPFTMLSSLPLGQSDWKEIAKNASWQTTRMNLNTFARHGVYEDAAVTRAIAARLRDAEEIAKSRVFPYQLLAAYQNIEPAVPDAVRAALHDAMELAVANVPSIEGTVVVCPDVSGSMQSPVTGDRGHGSTSKVRCIDVAALVAAAVMRKNPDRTIVLPFEQDVVKVDLSADDSILNNAAKLARVGGGGTNCSAPLRQLNKARTRADLVIFVSDNESWVDQARGSGTAVMEAWTEFRRGNPKARLVCLDIQPNRTTQAVERDDVLNIGGFSDHVFELIATFAAGKLAAADHWVSKIEAVQV